MTTQPVTHHQPEENQMNTKTIATQQAEATGRRAADIATAEVSPGVALPRQPLFLLAGGLLQTLRGGQRSRDGLIQAVYEYTHELTGGAGLEVLELTPDERGTQRSADVTDCRVWLKHLRACMAQQPAAVRVGIEAWVDEYINSQNLHPDTLEEIN